MNLSRICWRLAVPTHQDCDAFPFGGRSLSMVSALDQYQSFLLVRAE
jgi:hypothetical protein